MSDTVKRMDRAEIAKRIERAEKLLQKGKTDVALEEYLQILAADPANDSICQMAADLSLSLQRIPEAVRLLGAMFERQIQAGDATRASLTYKKLARFANPTWEQKVRFGELLESNNRKLALETYEDAFQEISKQGRKQDALSVLQRILKLDSSEKNLVRLGELSSEVGDGKGAAAAFLKISEMTRAAGNNPASWIERAYAEDPTDPQIALAYSKGLVEQGQVGAAIFVLEPLVNAGSAPQEIRETYGQALLRANRLSDAEPILWQLFEENPSRTQDIATLIGLLLDSSQDADAVTLARKLEQYQRRKGDRRAFLTLMQELVAGHRPSVDMLEFMSEQFNSSNREADYCQTLLKLFDLHCSTGNYEKAAESLDRAAEVDAYEPGHSKRLEMLRGKIDENRFKVIASRFTSMADSTAAVVRTEEKLLGAAALQDLMLQAEILVQYGMRAKALERLQRIQQLFPHEEERNPALQQLYLSAGLIPHYPGAETAAVAPVASPPPVSASVPTAAPSSAGDVSGFARVAEITRKLNRQSNAEAVMSTAANEIGTQWKVARCIVAMRKAGQKPTRVKEFCAGGTDAADGTALEKIVCVAHDAAIRQGSMLAVSNVRSSPELAAVQDVCEDLGMASLLILPLAEGTEHTGVVLLSQSSVQVWNPNDVLVLKTICDQILIALNNAGLRRLVKSLSVTDERSGLLKRASYIDLLMAETRRNSQQGTPLSILLLQFGEKSSMLKDYGEGAVESLMQQIGQIFAANIRQNDLAFRYEATSVAIVLGETNEKEGILAAEKLQRLVAQVKLPDRDDPLRFNAGLAEAVIRPEYDPVDVVTEVINRVEQALHLSIAQGASKVVILAASVAAAAVA